MSEAVRPVRRDRESRRIARQKHAQAKMPFRERGIPVTELHSVEALEIIEHNAETVLEEIGVRFRDDPIAVALWHGAGADVKGDRVHIPRGLARELLKTAPSEFLMESRNPARNIRIGGTVPAPT